MYQDIITADKGTTKKLIPMKIRRQKIKHRDNERVKLVTSDTQAAYVTYTENPTEEKHGNLNGKKKI